MTNAADQLYIMDMVSKVALKDKNNRQKNNYEHKWKTQKIEV